MTRISIIERIKELMHRLHPDCQTILYGSQARGDANEQSDIDLLILVDGDYLSIEKEKQISFPLFSIEIETGVSISPLIMLKKKWENRPIKTPFYLNVKSEGIIL